MLELEENLKILNELNEKLNEIKTSMKIENLKIELKELENKSLEENFWQNSENSTKIFSKIKYLQKKINSYEDICSKLNNLKEINNLLESEFDEELFKELVNNTKNIKEKIDT